MTRRFCHLISALIVLAVMWAATAAQALQVPRDPSASAPDQTKSDPDYVLGPDDQLTFWVPDAEDWNAKLVRIDGRGMITLPLIGSVRAGGLSVAQLQELVVQRLDRYFKAPEVVVNVTEYRSQPVSVIGAVNNPGVHQLQGHKTLVEILSLAGGLKPDAGNVAKISRRKEYGPIPLPDERMNASGEFSTAEVDLNTLLKAQNPENNIDIKPHDVITVPRAEMVFVMGEVEHAGGFVITERRSPTVMSALALAGGMKSTAKAKDARILRARAGDTQAREETTLDLSRILDGKATDVSLEPDDILFIPSNQSRKVAIRAAEAAVETLTGIAIWHSAR